MSIASKESLRLPLAFLKALNREISNAQALSFVPTSMRLDVVLAAIESHSKALDSNQRDEFAALRRGQSFAGQQQSSSTDVSDLSIPLHLVKFLASSGDNDDNNEYADRPSLSMNKAYSGCSFSIMPSTPETIRPFARSNSCVMDSVLSPSFVLRSPLPSEIAAAPAPRPLSPRKVLGPPPSVLRQEFDE